MSIGYLEIWKNLYLVRVFHPGLNTRNCQSGGHNLSFSSIISARALSSQTGEKPKA
jgi:hypothetical protein